VAKTVRKPAKPRADFPLFPHASGRWCKKVRGRFVYFGPWSDPDAAEQKWLDWKDDLLAGRKPRLGQGEGLVVKELVNRFLTSKQLLLDSGELSPRTFDGYHKTCERIVAQFGRMRLVPDLAADDFETLRAALAKGRSAVWLEAEIRRCRMVFKYAADNGLIDKPILYGQGFRKPSRKTLLKERTGRGVRLFEAPTLRKLLDAASPQLRCMMLLTLNGGVGNTDLALLPWSAIDLETGWLDYPRGKTGTARRVPLWPETIAALREVRKVRPAPALAKDERLVFLTIRGRPWKSPHAAGGCPISARFRDLLRASKIERGSYYWLRHCFATQAGEGCDQIAVDAVMGHAVDANDMPANYRQKISDERLVRVVNVVRDWLYAEQPKPR
jgi:integrase